MKIVAQQKITLQKTRTIEPEFVSQTKEKLGSKFMVVGAITALGPYHSSLAR